MPNERPTDPAEHSKTSPSRLSVCPVCDYPLDGLPGPHRCPECGLAYDEQSRDWPAGPPPLRQEPLFWFSLGSFLVFPVLVWLIDPTDLFSTATGAVFIALETSFLMLPLRAARGRHYAIAVLPNGIHLEREGCKTIVPWANVLGARVLPGRSARGVQLYHRRFGLVRNVNLGHLLPMPESREEFAKAVVDGRQRYAGKLETSDEH